MNISPLRSWSLWWGIWYYKHSLPCKLKLLWKKAENGPMGKRFYVQHRFGCLMKWWNRQLRQEWNVCRTKCPQKLPELRRSDMWSWMNLTAIEMLDFYATPTEFEKVGGIVMAINIPSLRDWIGDLVKMCLQNSIIHHVNSKKFPVGKFALSP